MTHMMAARARLFGSFLVAVTASVAADAASVLPAGLPPVPTRHHQFRPGDFRANDGSDGPSRRLQFRDSDEQKAQSLPCDHPDLPGCFTADFTERGILPMLNTSDYGHDGWTACMWIRAFENPYTFFHWGNTWASTYWYIGYVDVHGGLFFPTNAGAAWEQTSQFHVTQDPSTVIDTWRHFCWVIDYNANEGEGDQYLYLEGQLAEGPHRFDNLVNPSSNPFAESGLQNIELGASTWGTIQFGDVRIYNAPLRPEEVCVVATGDETGCNVTRPEQPEGEDEDEDEPFFPPHPSSTPSPEPVPASSTAPATTSQLPSTSEAPTTTQVPTSSSEAPTTSETPTTTPPPPPPTTAAAPPPGVLFDAEGRSILNSYCANWRDLRLHMSALEQKQTMARCMAQDCEQSVEAQQSCRWLDADGACYVYEEAQLWCTLNPASPDCNDGGADWAVEPYGVAPTLDDVNWMPMQVVDVENPQSGEDASFSCSCVRHCTCSRGSTTSTCYCLDGQYTQPFGFNSDFDADYRFFSSSSKRGSCACSCGGVLG